MLPPTPPLSKLALHPLFDPRRAPSLRRISSLPPHRPRLALLADECESMEQLKQVHAQMILTGRVYDQFALSRLISFSALSESGDLSYSVKIFDYIRNPNNFIWNTLIRAQAGGSYPLEGLKLYVKMMRSGISPNDHTYPYVIKACSCFKSLDSCRQIHAQVLKGGFKLDFRVFNGLLRCYCDCSDLSHACKLFDEIPTRNLSAWTIMISGYVQNSCLNDASRLFDQMVSEGFELSDLILASVLSACAHCGCLEVGKKVHAYLDGRNIVINVILGTSLVYMYAKNGEISVARSLFYGMEERNIATWNAMICGLASHGHAGEALDLFLKLEKEEVVPNDITFVGVLSACCHAGLVDKGNEIFKMMKSCYGVEPRIEHYGCIVDLLGRSGKLLEAEELIKRMPFKADAGIWGALLSACESHHNVEVAENVAKEMLALEPNNHGVYVVLSNIYAEAGRWKDIERLRKMMKKKNLLKTPGRSFVGVDY